MNTKNDEDGIVDPKNGVEPDKEAPQHRKIGPTPDEEAYATDKEAVQHRNIEPKADEDEPLPRNNRPQPDKEAVKQRKNR